MLPNRLYVLQIQAEEPCVLFESACAGLFLRQLESIHNMAGDQYKLPQKPTRHFEPFCLVGTTTTNDITIRQKVPRILVSL